MSTGDQRLALSASIARSQTQTDRLYLTADTTVVDALADSAQFPESACVGPSWTAGSEHCGHPDRPIVDTEIGVVDSEIATMDAEIGTVDSEIADRV